MWLPAYLVVDVRFPCCWCFCVIFKNKMAQLTQASVLRAWARAWVQDPPGLLDCPVKTKQTKVIISLLGNFCSGKRKEGYPKRSGIPSPLSLTENHSVSGLVRYASILLWAFSCSFLFRSHPGFGVITKSPLTTGFWELWPPDSRALHSPHASRAWPLLHFWPGGRGEEAASSSTSLKELMLAIVRCLLFFDSS